jgi:uncharacterized membrane protein YuzA (DUF378 family)
MFIVYLILLVWIGYASWFSYDLTKEQTGDDRKWWNPIFYFVVGVFAAIMIVVEFIEKSMRHAAHALNERDKRKRDAARAEKGEQ